MGGWFSLLSACGAFCKILFFLNHLSVNGLHDSHYFSPTPANADKQTHIQLVMNALHPLIAVGLLALPSPAQEPTPPKTDTTLVDSILGELGELEAPVEYGSQDSFIGIHGFFDLVYRNGENQNAGFDLHHANLLLDVAVSQDADARIEFEWEHGGNAVETDQIYLDYHPFANNTSFLMGRFYTPFGVERRVWYPPVSKTVTRPLVFREVVPGNWYETGAMVVWKDQDKDPMFQVEAALTNGLGASLDTNPRTARQSTDNNQGLMFSGRAGMEIDAVGGGFSWASGNYDGDDQNAFRYLGVDVGIELEVASLNAEWVSSTVDTPLAPGGSFDRDGWYVQVYCPVLKEEQEFGLFTRFDRVDPDSRVADANDRNATSLGLRWVPSSQVTFKMEYQKVNPTAQGNWPGQDLFALQVVLDF